MRGIFFFFFRPLALSIKPAARTHAVKLNLFLPPFFSFFRRACKIYTVRFFKFSCYRVNLNVLMRVSQFRENFSKAIEGQRKRKKKSARPRDKAEPDIHTEGRSTRE